MPNKTKQPLPELIKMLEPDRARVCQGIIEQYDSNIWVIPGASHNHQTWEGGYISHIEEAMNLAVVLYDALASCRKLPFAQTDVMFVVFLHDFDKLERYVKIDGKIHRKASYSNNYHEQLIRLLREKYHYELSADEVNALRYVHGELGDYRSDRRVMGPLATLAHCCDMISARIWFNEGRVADRW